MNRPFESIFLQRLVEWGIESRLGAFAGGVVVTLLTFGYLSLLEDAFSAWGWFGVLGTLLMWVLVFLAASGMLLSKIPWVYERTSTVVATLYLSGADEEQVDRSVITVRSMGQDHGLKVIHEQTMRGEDVPDDLKHLKHRLLSLRGTIHKMKSFNQDANEFLNTQGIHIFTSGDAAHEIEEHE